METFSKDELENIDQLLFSDDPININLAFSLLRGRWKLSKVKRYIARKFLTNIILEEYYSNWIIRKNSNYRFRTNERFIKDVMIGKFQWKYDWYSKLIIKELYNFEKCGITPFLLNGKWKDE